MFDNRHDSCSFLRLSLFENLIFIVKMLNRNNASQRTPIGEESLYLELDYSLTRLNLTNIENMLCFVCSKSVESKLVKLETSSKVILLLASLLKKSAKAL